MASSISQIKATPEFQFSLERIWAWKKTLTYQSEREETNTFDTLLQKDTDHEVFLNEVPMQFEIVKYVNFPHDSR